MNAFLIMGPTVLARVTDATADGFWWDADFAPTVAFDEVRPLFEEAQALLDREAWDEWEALWQSVRDRGDSLACRRRRKSCRVCALRGRSPLSVPVLSDQASLAHPLRPCGLVYLIEARKFERHTIHFARWSANEDLQAMTTWTNGDRA